MTNEERPPGGAVREDETAENPGNVHKGVFSRPFSDAGDKRARRRGIYLLPNLITSAALFAGVFAIVSAANGNFVSAALAIFVSLLFDTADGRVARWTRTDSDFGAEYDSLSDMVAFGVAPAMVAYFWGLNSLGRIGWIATFIYVACAALRLARFNTQGDNESFTGLASPSAAAIIACTVWVWGDVVGGTPSAFAVSAVGMLVVLIALLMVSNFHYFSPKQIDVKNRVPFVTLVLAAIVFAVLVADPPKVLLVIFSVYALSGPVAFVVRRVRGTNPES